ncbi:uncharacterized protein LOC34618229 [Cyclospora cayetanensis]|uniref:ubiquitinyl hydrolase 1 n=1 Tax=Cyclospora cayetanensis TaxID=88456 RepID=A0A6P6RQP9_9EIME|nr:uncharacterized protein LOC34618229 [Cyclospora cayetanensis]
MQLRPSAKPLSASRGKENEVPAPTAGPAGVRVVRTRSAFPQVHIFLSPILRVSRSLRDACEQLEGLHEAIQRGQKRTPKAFPSTTPIFSSTAPDCLAYSRNLQGPQGTAQMVYRLKQSSPSWATNVDCAPPELDAGPPAVAPACARGPAVASRTAATSGSQGSGFLQRRVSQRWRLVGNRGGRHTHQHQSQQDQAAKFSESSCVLQQKEYLVTSSVCPVNASPIDGIEGVDTTKEPSREPLHSRQPATLKLHRSGGAGVDSSTAGNGPMQGESVNTALQPAAKWKAGPPWDVGTPQVVDLEGAAGSCGGDVGANSRIAPRADCVNPNSTRSISSICRRTRWKSLPLGLPCVLPGQPPLDGSRSASEPVKLCASASSVRSGARRQTDRSVDARCWPQLLSRHATRRSCLSRHAGARGQSCTSDRGQGGAYKNKQSQGVPTSESQHHQQQREESDHADWDECSMSQPADEQNDVATSCSHSSSTEISLRKGRRVASRLQRMASSMGCFGEAALRRIEPQRGGSPVVTSAEHKAWRKQLESLRFVLPEDGSFFPRGLTNLKNTCFLNAALQALAGIPSFVSTLQEGLPPEPGYSGAFWGPQRLINEEFDGVHEETSAVAAAGCSSTTATPPNEDATGQQQQQELQRRQILRQLRLQQQRRRQQPQNLTTLDENQRRLLLREFFTLLCRLTCCPNVRPVDRGVDPHEGLAARRPRHSNSQATCRTEASPHQQQQTAATQPGSIRPERLRRALVAPLEGLLLKDCSLQQQQDCHEFLRGLIDIVHEILKTCRWEREEAAAEQLLQLQAEVSFSALRSCSPSVSDSPLAPFEDKDNQQQEQLPPTGSSVSATAASSLSSLICPLQSSLSGPPVVQALKGLPSVGSQLETSGDKGTGELAERSNNDEGGLDLAEKKWKEYLEDQASPMSDFFAGQLCSEIRCSCGRSLSVYEPAWDLSLPLPAIASKVSLSTLLDSFFGAEELEFRCSNCRNPACTAIRTLRYTHPPRVLLLQIKRFSAVGQKRRSKVEFPLENLSIQLSRGSASFRLIAVIEHKGSSCHTGHYVAYVRRKRFQFPQSTPSKMHSQALGAQGASPRGLWASGGSSLRPDTPRNSACSPSELLKRIGLFSRSNSSLQSPIVSQPNSPSTSTPSACGSPYHSGAQRPHGVSTQETLPPTRLHRYGGVNQGSIDDASEVSMCVCVNERIGGAGGGSILPLLLQDGSRGEPTAQNLGLGSGYYYHWF